jgi:hypothetical protein
VKVSLMIDTFLDELLPSVSEIQAVSFSIMKMDAVNFN